MIKLIVLIVLIITPGFLISVSDNYKKKSIINDDDVKKEAVTVTEHYSYSY